MASMNESFAGRIDERGFLKSLYRKGFTHSKCLLELVANTLDALDKLASRQELNKKLAFDVKDKNILMIDNGYGMTRNAAENMFAMHRENHEDDTSRGVSGIGAKPALSILSDKKAVHLFTRVPDGEYLHIIVPWDRIHAEGKYTEMISICYMTELEKIGFEKERQDKKMISTNGAHGTTIKFPYNNKLKRTIEDNFLPMNDSNEDIKPLDRIGVVFGRDTFECTYNHYEDVGNTRILTKYNYLQETDDKFYRGKSEDIIQMWMNSDGLVRFLWKNPDGQNYEIHSVGRGLSKKPEPCTTNTNGCRKVGEFTVKTGLRKFAAFFDHEHPALPVSSSAEKNMNPYHTEHLGKDYIDFLSSYKLVRNGQLIGLIPPPDGKVSNHRANIDAFAALVMLQCEVSYNPVSSQDSPQDHAMNIQENKNQYDGESVDKRFTRIVAAIKKKKFAEIWNYFESASRAALPLPAEVLEDDTAEEEAEAEAEAEEGLVDDSSTETPPPAPPNTLLDFFRAVENKTPIQAVIESPPVETVIQTPPTEIVVETIPTTLQHPIIPINVRQHRRGLVHGHELMQEIQKFSERLNANAEYTDDATISIYNSLMNY